MFEVTQIISARWDQGPKESTSLERSISEVWYAARAIFQFRNHRASEMEQNELLAEAFEPLSLFEVSRFPCRVQNTLSWDTITLGSYWSFPKPDTRLAEHVNNFRVSNLIAHIFEKLTQDTVLLSKFETATLGKSNGMYPTNIPVSLTNLVEILWV